MNQSLKHSEVHEVSLISYHDKKTKNWRDAHRKSELKELEAKQEARRESAKWTWGETHPVQECKKGK